MSSRIAQYTPEHTEKVLKLIQAKSFKSKIWAWQFHQNERHTDKTPIIALDKWNEIIGFNGVMPTQCKIGDKQVSALWSCDFYINEAYRGKGIGKDIKKVLNTHSTLIMTFGVSDNAVNVLHHSNWQQNLEVSTYYKIQKWDNITDFIKKYISQFIQFLNPLPKSIYTTIITNDLPNQELIDYLWHQYKDQYRNLVSRDYQYLLWKYKNHPLAKYQYALTSENGQIISLTIFRRTSRYCKIVDYIGPAIENDKLFIIKLLSSSSPDQKIINCTTSCEHWKKALEKSGFRRMKIQPRFFIYTNNPSDDIYKNWFIMAGDSDADLLQASQDGPFKNLAKTQTYQVRLITEQEFLQMDETWDQLVLQSNADELFMGRQWLQRWWQQWSKELKLSMFTIAVFDHNEQLVGLAPLYKYNSRSPPNLRKIQFIGTSWKIKPTVRTEYLDFIIHKHHPKAGNLIAERLQSEPDWHEFIACDMEASRGSLESIHMLNSKHTIYQRTVLNDSGVVIDTQHGFNPYLKKLGKNTRLKLYNRRSLLNELGNVSIRYANHDDLDYYFDTLNFFHKERWGKPCFNDNALNFHCELSSYYLKLSKLKFSLLLLDEKPISILYNIEVGNKIYNLQAGFSEFFDKRISLGLIHLGYEIELAFEDKNIHYFDLLAGHGKNTFYKSHLGPIVSHFKSIRLVRDLKMRWMFKAFDNLPPKPKLLAQRIFRWLKKD